MTTQGSFTIILMKIGEYNRIQFNDIQHIFIGKIIGGQETSKVKWFKLNNLPLLMVPHRKEQIKIRLCHNSRVVLINR
ncbi:hypothetical protein LL037_07940 [Clostridium estertheticum]|uniref:hypothetical protein n=1 Tax=Clostridium estertheticum TaxID=238834 RepID=UPI001C0BF2DD|nr:hypothetical protein [Clostridium estertheticum]MBU3199848.1 hypothetical protein [Clostridium estertheticum]WAG67050.1 hypothetical protein LL037_07940 [Clostridium estertheticum]